MPTTHDPDLIAVVQAAKRLSEYDPHNKHYRLGLAGALDELKQHEEAAMILQLLERDEPDDPELQNNIAFNLHLQGKWAAAVPHYEYAIRLAPDYAYPYDNLGFARYKLGFKEEGLRLIDHSLTLDKGNAYAYLFKGKIFLETGEYAKAKEQFDLALRYRYTEDYGYAVEELLQQLPYHD